MHGTSVLAADAPAADIFFGLVFVAIGVLFVTTANKKLKHVLAPTQSDPLLGACSRQTGHARLRFHSYHLLRARPQYAMNELLGTVGLIGVAIMFTGGVIRLRALVANRVANRGGETELLRRMQREARRAARVLVIVGACVTVLGFIGWLLTK